MIKYKKKEKEINPLFRLANRPYIVIEPKDKGKITDIYEFLVNSDYLLAELIDGSYAVKPEAIDELQARRMKYKEVLRYPMPKEARSRIREMLKKNGVMAPI